MALEDPARLGLGDFYDTGSDHLLDPGPEYASWKASAGAAFDLFEPELLTGPTPRATLGAAGGRRDVINLTSYNYLGLAQHPRVIAAAESALREFGTGACGSPILSGMTVLHRDLEERIARFAGREQAILFNSGNAGAIGVLSALLRRGDVAVLDQYAHICLVEGARLAGARVMTFAHNDAEDLDRLLAAHEGRRRLVVVEGLYSMHGTHGALQDIVPVVRAHGVELMVDEAHSVLATGENGRGTAELFGVEDGVGLVYGTFSKAFGNIGGYVAGTARALDYIRYFANTYVFSAALPPAVVAGIAAALEVASNEPGLRRTLADNADYFRDGLKGLGLDAGASCAHVIPIIVGSDRARLYELTATLRERGVFVAPVDYPSVPENQLRLRTCVTAAHTRADLDEALSIIADTVAPGLR